MDDHNPDHVNPSGDDNGDVYVDCDNIIQVFMDVSIAAFWVVLSYNLVGVYLATFWEMCFNFRVNFEDGGGDILSKRRYPPAGLYEGTDQKMKNLSLIY